MSIFELLSRLEELGITLQTVDSGLKVHGPKGRLTPDLIDELREKKQEIMTLLQRRVQKGKGYTSVESAEKREYYMLSPAQKRLYIIQQMEAAQTAYNMPQIISLSQVVDREKLLWVFKEIIARHDSLRTSFLMVDDEPMQRIYDDAEFEIEYYRADHKAQSTGHKEEHHARCAMDCAGTIKDLVRPFNLSRPPLLRVGFIKTGGNENIVMIDMHHIISDGTSQGILKREFLSLLADRVQPLPPLRLQYKDYGQWLNRPVQQQRFSAQESYWLEVFAGELPVLNLPLDYPRPESLNFAGETITFTLTREETRGLKTISCQPDVTLYMKLLSIFNILLAKLGGQDDITVGTPIAARRHPDLERIIGMFVNTLPIRNYPRGDKPFGLFLEEVKQHTLEAYENQEFPFEELVEKRLTQRDTSRNPLFDVMINLLNQEDYQGEIPESASNTPPSPGYENRTSKFDLTLTCVDLGAQLLFALEYCSKLFKKDSILGFISYFKTILRQVSRPGIEDKQLSGLDIITDEEKKILLEQFNDTGVDFPRDKTIHQLFQKQAEKTPGYIGLVGQKLQNTNQNTFYDRILLTYEELNNRSDRLAYYLQERGVKTDTIVGLMVERSLEMIIGILGILKAGGAYLPIDTQYPESRKTYMLKDSGTRFLLTAPQVNIKADERSIEIIDISGLLSYSTLTLTLTSTLTSTSTCQVNPANLVYMLYTSGSTGKPKGVMLEHGNLVNLLIWGFRSTNLDFSAVLQFATIGFDASFHEIFSALLSGGKLCLIRRETQTDFPGLFAIIRKHNIKTLFLPMAVLKVIFNDEDLIGSFPSCVTHIQTAGEQVVVSPRFRTYLQENQIHLHNHYGPTEAHVVTALTLSPAGEIPNLPPIGSPVSNTAIYILDQYKNIQPVGIPGELYIGGVQVGRGYLNQPQLTSKKFINYKLQNTNYKQITNYNVQNYKQKRKSHQLHELTRIKITTNEKFLRGFQMFHGQFLQKAPPGRRRQKIYRSGDLARWQPGGNIEFLGRIDSQVKIRGFRIELGEIENCLLKKPGVKDVVVLANTDEGNDKFLCAYMVSDSEVEPAELRKYLSTYLPGYMLPAYFIAIDHIPLTPNGKIDRKALPAPVLETISHYVSPTNEKEKKLAAIWSEVLHMDKNKIGIHDNFFALGGHSLSATILTAKIHKEFNIKVSLADIFKYQCISRLAGYMEKSEENRYAGIEPVEKREYYKLSSAQKRLYFLQQLDPGSTAYNMPMVVPMDKNTRESKLERTIKKLIARHESLRTSFPLVGTEPVQRVHEPGEIEFEVHHYGTVEDTQDTGAIMGTMPGNLTGSIRRMVRSFDLSRAPLVRSALVKHPDGTFSWLVDMHHIISDGTSQSILKQDFLSLYLDGNEELPPLELQYKDYCLWLNRPVQQQKFKEQERYWLEVFNGELPVLNLPLDFPRPAYQGFEGDTIDFTLSPQDTQNLKKFPGDADITLYMKLLSIFYILLAKLGGQEEIIIGTAIASRKHAALTKIIGMFVNTLSLKNYPVGKRTFIEFLGNVKKQILTAFENQEYPFEQLVEKLSAKRDTGRNPLFDVMFVMLNMSTGREDLEQEPEIETNQPAQPDIPEEYEKILQTSKFDLTLNALDRGREILLSFQYCSRLFKKETIERFIVYFKKIVSTIVKEPGIRIEEIEIIREEEKKQILYDFNDTQADYPENKTIHRLFEEQAASTPDHTAVVGTLPRKSRAYTTDITYISYRELDKLSGQLACLLQEKAVGPGSIAGIMAERSLEMVIGILGILKTGGAYLPIDPGFPGDRIDYMLKDSCSKILLSGQEIAGLYWPQASKIGLKSTPSHLHRLPASRNCLAYILYTSGSMGKPKGVMVNHASVVNLLLALQQVYPLTRSDTYLLKTSYLFDVSVTELFGWYIGGGRLAILETNGEKDPGIIMDTIEREKITHINFVPSMFNVFLDELNHGNIEKLSGLKYVFIAGEAILPGLVNKYRQLDIHIPLENLYGPTEGTVYASGYSLSHWVSPASVPIGKPIPNTRLYILNRNYLLQPIGVPGELVIGGAGLARGYLNKPELTAEKFCFWQPGGSFYKNHPLDPRKNFLLKGTGKKYTPKYAIYLTGDLTRWLPDGNIEFLGRIDHQVKIRGFRVELGEIENQLMSHVDIKEAVVITRAYKNGNSYLCAYIASARDFLVPELRRYLEGRLPDYMIPSGFVLLEKIPLTNSGKVDRQTLNSIGKKLSTSVQHIAPQSENEILIANAWKNILKLDDVSVTDNFFDLGGTSIDIIQVNSKMKEIFKRDIPIIAMYRYTTIESFSHFLDQGNSHAGNNPISARYKERADEIKKGKEDKNKRREIRSRRRK